MSASLRAVSIKVLLDKITQRISLISPAIILAELDRELRTQKQTDFSDDGLDISLVSIEAETGLVRFAGTRLGCYLVDSKCCHHYKGQVKRIGTQRKDKNSIEDLVIDIKGSSKIYLLSDGLRDQKGMNQLPLGSKGSLSLLERIAKLEPENQRREIANLLRIHQGDVPQTDDITVAGFSVEPPKPSSFFTIDNMKYS